MCPTSTSGFDKTRENWKKCLIKIIFRLSDFLKNMSGPLTTEKYLKLTASSMCSNHFLRHVGRAWINPGRWYTEVEIIMELINFWTFLSIWIKNRPQNATRMHLKPSFFSKNFGGGMAPDDPLTLASCLWYLMQMSRDHTHFSRFYFDPFVSLSISHFAWSWLIFWSSNKTHSHVHMIKLVSVQYRSMWNRLSIIIVQACVRKLKTHPFF